MVRHNLTNQKADKTQLIQKNESIDCRPQLGIKKVNSLRQQIKKGEEIRNTNNNNKYVIQI